MVHSENKPVARAAAGSAYEAENGQERDVAASAIAVADEVIVCDAVPDEEEALDVVSIKQLTDKKVWEGRPSQHDAGALKKLGRVKAFVFHPSDKRCIGFLVRRPDAALMFRRHDVFVGISGFDIIDGHIVVSAEPHARDKGALKAAGISLNECAIWQGLPVVCENGAVLGTVGDVLCELGSGDVYSLEVSKGIAANTMLGTLIIMADEIIGFDVRSVAEEPGGGEDGGRNAAAGGNRTVGGRLPVIVVDDSVQFREVEGGIAEKAGEATAVIAHNAKKAMAKVKPKAKEVTSAAGDAVNQGAYLAGRQIERSKGMFSAFKEEFDNALHGEDD